MATSTVAVVGALLQVAWVVLAWWVVLGRHHRTGRVGVPDLVVSAAAWLVGLAAQTVLVVVTGGNIWRIWAVAYLDVVLALPLLGLLGLVGHLVAGRLRARRPSGGHPAGDVPASGAPPRDPGPDDLARIEVGTDDPSRRDSTVDRRTAGAAAPVARHLGPLALAAALAGLVLGPLGWHATHVAPHDLRVEEVTLAVPDADGDDPVRIGVLADLQTERIGDYERRAVATLLAQRPDVVVVPGDLFQGGEQRFAEDRDELVALLGQLRVPGGLFVVGGDVDRRRALEAVVEEVGGTYLHDEVATAAVGDRRLAIAGVPLNPGSTSTALPTLADRPAGTVGILVAHRPDWVLRDDAPAADLVVSGHTHGGQIQLPFIGPLVTHSRVPRHVAAGGLHEVGGVPLYVSTGVGHEQQGAPQVRFLAPPSVAIVELTG